MFPNFYNLTLHSLIKKIGRKTKFIAKEHIPSKNTNMLAKTFLSVFISLQKSYFKPFEITYLQIKIVPKRWGRDV